MGEVGGDIFTKETRYQCLGHQRYPYMTVLCDHEYLAGVREKIKLIQAFTLQISAA